MTTEMQDQSYAFNDLIKFPEIVLSAHSLTPMEKMLLGNFLLMSRPKVVVELGVYRAQTTEFICQFLELNGIDAPVYGFDIPEQIEEIRTQNSRVQALEASGRLHLIPGWLPDSLQSWLDDHTNLQIDFALVDATHEYPNVTSELELIWPRIARHGVVMCHDYDRRPEHEGVRYAVDRFAARTANVQMCSLFVPQDASLPDIPVSLEPEVVDQYKLISTLAVLRHRPYEYSQQRLMTHLNEEVKWKYQRNKPMIEQRQAQVKNFIRSTPFFKAARNLKNRLLK